MESTVGVRLRAAVGRWGSIRSFAKAVKDSPEGGRSSRMIHSYLKGTRDPPLSFIRDAAQLLRVREAWLAFGEYPISDVVVAVDDDLTPRVEEKWEWLIGDSVTVKGQLHALLNRRVAAARANGAAVDDTTIVEWADELGKLVTQPREQLTRGIGSNDFDWYNYRVAMIHALMLVFSEGYLHRPTGPQESNA